MTKQPQWVHRIVIVLSVVMMAARMLAAIPAGAQFQTEFHPLDTFLTNILNFKDQTGIRGTLQFIDFESQTLWLDWQERSDDRPAFYT